MRDKSELLSLVEKLKEFCPQDLGIEFSPERFSKALSHLSEVRLIEFIKRRFGHLPDSDFIRFAELALEDEKEGTGKIHKTSRKPVS